MSRMFCFRGMFRPHIENSNLKMPENFDEYNPEEYPHFHVFMLMHLAKPIDITALESNANIIAEISEEDIRKVTPKDLFDMGIELGCGDLV